MNIGLYVGLGALAPAAPAPFPKPDRTVSQMNPMPTQEDLGKLNTYNGLTEGFKTTYNGLPATLYPYYVNTRPNPDPARMKYTLIVPYKDGSGKTIIEYDNNFKKISSSEQLRLTYR